MHPSIVCVGASRVVNLLSTPCKRLLSPFCRLNRQPHCRIQGGPECAAALPRLPRLARRSTSEGDGGFCHGVPRAFQVQVARGLTGKPRMGMGSTLITPAYITAAAGGLGKLAQDLLSPAAAPRIEPQRLRTSAGPRQMK